MRILFSANPAHGHLLPLLPLARALRIRGNDVAFLTSGGIASALEREAFTVLAAGPMPDALFAAAEGTGDVAGNPTAGSVVAFFVDARLDLGGDEALAAARGWAPDLVVAEVCDVVGPMVAAAQRVPLADFAFGPALPAELMEPLRARARERYLARGLDPVEPRWLVDVCPPSLQQDGWVAPARHVALRPEAHRVPGGRWPRRPVTARRRVLVSFGTHFADPAVLDPILAALSTVDADLLVTLGFTAAPEDFPSAGPGVEFAPFAPLSHLLTGVDAVLTHGGAGTTLGALAHGLPLVIVPQGADHGVQADRVAAAGAGVVFAQGAAAPRAIADAVATVLADPAIGDNARRVAADIAALPAPDAAAAVLTVAPTAAPTAAPAQPANDWVPSTDSSASRSASSVPGSTV